MAKELKTIKLRFEEAELIIETDIPKSRCMKVMLHAIMIKAKKEDPEGLEKEMKRFLDYYVGILEASHFKERQKALASDNYDYEVTDPPEGYGFNWWRRLMEMPPHDIMLNHRARYRG